ncbi:hypothetical protein BKA66DRAFT_572338 [Pyrenochaeta sp. MPI-SDFR-AT-0127]|nr:hypothetical protein BKA66DRAFT_572338 [Pyrenochaeta sp. MPI-SDFR-AT-0127]
MSQAYWQFTLFKTAEHFAKARRVLLGIQGGPAKYAAQMSFIQRVSSSAPLGYRTPPFPSLYWPLPAGVAQSFYLYDPGDILRFTVYWTLLLVGGIHLITALWACLIQWRNWKLIWITLPAFVLVGGFEALVSGAIVGALLGGVYQAGYFEMSTWIPFVWGVINTLVLILSSFAIYGGL